MTRPNDMEWMNIALAAARRTPFCALDVPRAGCVIVSKEGICAGEGVTQRTGETDALNMALHQANASDAYLAGATTYLTLEPSYSAAQADSCCLALAQSGVSRVVACSEGADPLFAGNLFRRLIAAGIRVEVGLAAPDAYELNIGLFSRIRRGIPWVRLKVAASLDGVTALFNGASQWITGEEARVDSHEWRARACTLLTGIGTVLADDPRFTVRLPHPIEREPAIAVVDSGLRIPLDASILVATRPRYIFTAVQRSDKKDALEQMGVEVISVPDADGLVDLRAVLRELSARGTNELHLEAGATLNGAFIKRRLVDELILYLSPRLFGLGRGMAEWGPLSSLADGLELDLRDVTIVGKDLRLQARVVGRSDF